MCNSRQFRLSLIQFFADSNDTHASLDHVGIPGTGIICASTRVDWGQRGRGMFKTVWAIPHVAIHACVTDFSWTSHDMEVVLNSFDVFDVMYKTL